MEWIKRIVYTILTLLLIASVLSKQSMTVRALDRVPDTLLKPEIMTYEDCIFLEDDKDIYNPDNYEFLYYIDMGNSVNYYDNFGYQTYYIVYSRVPVVFAKNEDDGYLYIYATANNHGINDNNGYLRLQYAIGLEHCSSQGSVVPDKGIQVRFGESDFYVEKIKGYYTNDPEGFLVFDSTEHAKNYIETGEIQGNLISHPVDYSKDHDFSKDVYHMEMITPQISNVSHKGFTFDNLPEDYYFEVITEHTLYGAKITSNISGNAILNVPVSGIVNAKIEADTTWKYWHTYKNWTDASEVVFGSRDLINGKTLDMETLFGYRPVEEMQNAFADWSVEYPTIKHLPSYSWVFTGLSDNYLQWHTKHDNGGPVRQLEQTGRMETVYYVRYRTADEKYSRWLKVTFRNKNTTNGEEYVSGTIDNGIVDGGTISEGENTTTIKNNVSGDVDSDGNVSYIQEYVPGETEVNATASLSEMIGVMNQFSFAIVNFQQFVTNMFSFLPWWANALLGLTIGVCCIFRIVGR